MQKALIFLNGTYKNPEFYDKEISDNKDSFIIAVDGALSLFQKIKKKPDIIIGDLDSIDKVISDIEIQKHPEQKENTDGELALKHCLEKGYTEIILYGGIDTRFETDHLLGNIFLMYNAIKFSRKENKKIEIKMRDFSQEIYLVEDNNLLIKGSKEDIISVIPLSPEVELNYTGLQYPMNNEKAYFGNSRTLRNTMISEEAEIDIKGIAVVVKHF